MPYNCPSIDSGYTGGMTKNPIINALSASAYIIFIVTVMTFVTKPLQNKPDTFFAPVTFLSVLTLSVVVMAYLFFYQPFLLFIEGKKKEAVNLFIKTVGIFAVITAVVLILLFSGLI
jgi:hypothetical protein